VFGRVMAVPPSTDDVIAIHQLLGLYGHVVDGHTERDRLDEVFTSDAIFDTADFGQGVHEGLDAIRAIFDLGAPPHPPAHIATNVYVYREDGQTYAHSKWLTIDRSTGGVRSGDYHDEMVDGPDGWRIARRTVIIRFYTGEAPQAPRHGGTDG
jgi:SnoaL-like domain